MSRSRSGLPGRGFLEPFLACRASSSMIVAMLDAHSEWLPRHPPGFLEQFCEILSILSQAASAAHYYEDLRRQCDAALAQRGLKRADLPRLAYTS